MIDKLLLRAKLGNNLRILLATTSVVCIATPAKALTINAIFDSYVTSLSNAATVEAAFNKAAAVFTNAFTNPIVVNINVGWNESSGIAMSSNQAGVSSASAAAMWTYAQVKAVMPALDNLPATQTGPKYFSMPLANAKALGLSPATSTSYDGSVAFNGYLTYDFDPSDGITSGSYDFVGLVKHEISEVLGRSTRVNPNGSTFYQTPADLFRYSAPGVQNYSYTTPTYFSLDRGNTNLGWFDNTGGDRSDWLSGSYSNSVQNAYINTGATSFAPADLQLFRAIGWNTTAQSLNYSGTSPGTTSGTFTGSSDIPEPATALILTAGLAGITLFRRRNS